nr:hypothetical protein GCM10025730_31810 [Promicromonospora thailandica]
MSGSTMVMRPDFMDDDVPSCVMVSVPVMEPFTEEPAGSEIFAVTLTSAARAVTLAVLDGPGEAAASGDAAAAVGAVETPGATAPATSSAAPSATPSDTRILDLITCTPLVRGTRTRPPQAHVHPLDPPRPRETVM